VSLWPFPPAPNAHDPKHLEYEQQIELAQARLITLSSNEKQIFVPRSSEYVSATTTASLHDR
jgi:hypothetical protein